MIHVAVLAGGTSAERDVSLRSAQAITTALQAKSYKTSVIDTAGVGLSELYEQLANTDVVFPVLHGAGGEDGTIQAFLEKHGIAYVGTGSVASALCFDKWQYKQALNRLGMPTPKAEIVNPENFSQSALMQRPYVLKPNDGGSSVDTFIIRTPETADLTAIQAALTKYGSMLLEELIEGQEITVGILGDKALPVIEIIPPANGEFDYENKYNGKSQELCPPRNVNSEIQREAQDFALHVHHALGVRDISRTDIMIRASDNALFILETNTIPGMTDQSLLPKAAAVAGLSMPDLVDMLIELARAHHA